MVTCRIKTATRRRGREGRGEGVEWWQEEECGRRSAGLKPYIILQQRGPRNMSLFRGPLYMGRGLLQFDVGNDLCTDGVVQGLHELVAAHVQFGA